MFRVGVLNYFIATNAGNEMNYVPTLLRIGGYMQNSEVTPNNGIAFFFDGNNIKLPDRELTVSEPLTPTDCASSLGSSIVCRYFISKEVNGNTPTKPHYDYYPGLNAIIIGGSAISDITEFNYYIPVRIIGLPFTYAFLALINNYATFPTVTSVYKLYGTTEINYDGDAIYKTYTPCSSTSLTAATKWTNQTTDVAPETNKLNSVEDWEVGSATLGVLNTYDNAPDSQDVTKTTNLAFN